MFRWLVNGESSEMPSRGTSRSRISEQNEKASGNINHPLRPSASTRRWTSQHCNFRAQRVLRSRPSKDTSSNRSERSDCTPVGASRSKRNKGKMSQEGQLAADALDTLHGARELPPKEAASVLRNSFNSIGSPNPDSFRAAASHAMENLINKLELEGSASDDDWQSAIETMLSLANETN